MGKKKSDQRDLGLDVSVRHPDKALRPGAPVDEWRRAGNKAGSSRIYRRLQTAGAAEEAKVGVSAYPRGGVAQVLLDELSAGRSGRFARGT